MMMHCDIDWEKGLAYRVEQPGQLVTAKYHMVIYHRMIEGQERVDEQTRIKLEVGNLSIHN
jgi:hypothetical protein